MQENSSEPQFLHWLRSEQMGIVANFCCIFSLSFLLLLFRRQCRHTLIFSFQWRTQYTAALKLALEITNLIHQIERFCVCN